MSLWSETAIAHTDLPAAQEGLRRFLCPAGLIFAAWLLACRDQPHVISHPI